MTESKSIPTRPLSERVTANLPSGIKKAMQQFKDEVDINSIVGRFIKSGVPIPAPQNKPVYYDMASLPANLHDALMLKERLRSSIATFSRSLQSAYNANPTEFMRSLDAHMARLKSNPPGPEKAPEGVSEPVSKDTPPPPPKG